MDFQSNAWWLAREIHEINNYSGFCGSVWELIVKRNLNDLERRQLAALAIFDFNNENRFEMRDLDDNLKQQIRQRLAEKRVVQHIPARMDGLPVDLNMWRLKGWKPDGKADLEKHSRDASGKRKSDTPNAGADNKDRLIGWQPENGNGKLKQLKAVLPHRHDPHTHGCA